MLRGSVRRVTKVTRATTLALIFDRGFAEKLGSVPEWLNGPHSKCGMPARVSEVRILPLPPIHEGLFFVGFVMNWLKENILKLISLLVNSKQRKIQTPKLDLFLHWPEKPYRWMLSGLVRAIEEVEGEDINYLVALGLVCYTEVMGHQIREFKKLPFGAGYSKASFDIFLGEYMGYKDLLAKYPIYDWFRCGLCHEFAIKNIDGGRKTGPFHFFVGSEDEKEIIKNNFDADVSKGIVIGSNGIRFLVIEPYLHDFINGIEIFLKESGKIS